VAGANRVPYLQPEGYEKESWLLGSTDMMRPLQRGFADLPHLQPNIYDLNTGEIRWILGAVIRDSR
jgi:hypothetical protein